MNNTIEVQKQKINEELKQIEQLKFNINELSNENSVLNSKCVQYEKENTHLEIEKNSLNNQMQTSQNTLNQLLDNLSQTQKYHEKTINDLNKDKNELQNKINMFSLEKQQYLNNEHQLNDKIKDLSRELNGINNIIK